MRCASHLFVYLHPPCGSAGVTLCAWSGGSSTSTSIICRRSLAAVAGAAQPDGHRPLTCQQLRRSSAYAIGTHTLCHWSAHAPLRRAAESPEPRGEALLNVPPLFFSWFNQEFEIQGCGRGKKKTKKHFADTSTSYHGWRPHMWKQGGALTFACESRARKVLATRTKERHIPQSWQWNQGISQNIICQNNGNTAAVTLGEIPPRYETATLWFICPCIYVKPPSLLKQLKCIISPFCSYR